MISTMPFDEVLEAVDHLTLEEQQNLLTIVNRKLSDRRRQQTIEDVRESREDFRAGKCKPTTPEQLMKDILS